jgi:cytochrome P450
VADEPLRSDLPNILDTDLPSLDYLGSKNVEEAHAIIGPIRQQAPIARGPFAPEVLSHELVQAALRDTRFRTPQAFSLAAQGITEGPLWDRAARNILSLDGPEHRRLRRLVAKAFTPRSAEKLRITSRDVITELVEPYTHTGRCDFVADVAQQFSIPIICAMLGAPRHDWQLFSTWADDIFKIFSWDVASNADVILKAWKALEAYFEELIKERRSALSDDIISDLIRAEDEGDTLTHAELLSLAVALLIGGTDTTRNQLAAAVQVLCDHPDQWALLTEHPELAPRAVAETIRHSPVAMSTFRTTVEDVELGGVVIPADTLILLNSAAANRDPAVYDDPDRLDITRDAPGAPIAFGGGIHHCLGVHLAKVELAEALTVIVRRMPNARRTGPAPWKPLMGLSGPSTLPLEFETYH